MKGWALVLAAIVAAGLAGEAVGGDSLNVTQVARIYNQWDVAYNVAVKGNYAYVATGLSGLQVVDITDSEHPALVGSWDENIGSAVSVAVSGDIACIADAEAGLRVIDISDPTQPAIVGTYNSPGYANDVVIKDTLALLADGWNSGLIIVNISNPVQPRRIGGCSTPGTAWRIAVNGDLAVIADMDAGFRVIDISRPTHPTEVGAYDFGGDDVAVYGAAISGSLALLSYTNDIGGGLRIFDISDPTHPQRRGNIYTEGTARDVTVSGNVALLAADAWGLRLIDISDPTDPNEIGVWDIGNQYGVQDALVINELAFVSYGRGGLQVVNISDPTQPESIGSFGTEWYVRTMAARENLALAGVSDLDFEFGLHLIDTSEPERPEVLCEYETPSPVNDVEVIQNLALLTEGRRGLSIIDINDPAEPDEIGFLNLWDPMGIAIGGPLAFVADGGYGRGLRVIDYSDPSQPDEIGFCEIEGSAQDVAVSDGMALMAGGSDGVIAIDVSDPENIEDIGSLGRLGPCESVKISNDLALVAAGYKGLRIIDISDPTRMREVGFLATQNWAHDVAVIGNLAIVADEEDGLRIIDFSDPTQPKEVGFYDTPGSAAQLAIVGDFIYVADWTNVGIYRLDIPMPEISLSEDTLVFGEVELDSSAQQRITITNLGSRDLLFNLTYTDSDFFKVEPDSQMTLLPDSCAELTVSFSPARTGDFIGEITVKSNDLLHPEVRIYLSGRCTPTSTNGGIEPLPHAFRLVSISPNPFNDRFTAQVAMPASGVVVCRMFDINGAMVFNRSLTLPTGTGRLTVDGAGLPAGAYLLKLSGGNHQATTRVVHLP